MQSKYLSIAYLHFFLLPGFIDQIICLPFQNINFRFFDDASEKRVKCLVVTAKMNQTLPRHPFHTQFTKNEIR